MPIVQKIMNKLKESYGKKKGKDVYFGLLNKGKINEKNKKSKKVNKVKKGKTTKTTKG